jgi:hypothetical protein
MTDLFNSRLYVVSKRVEGIDIDEVFLWIDEQEMDCLCQGILQGTPTDLDDPEWHSVWSFGTEEERVMWVLRFGTD